MLAQPSEDAAFTPVTVTPAQAQAWGEDTEAMQRRAILAADIESAARFIELLNERG